MENYIKLSVNAESVRRLYEQGRITKAQVNLAVEKLGISVAEREAIKNGPAPTEQPEA